MRGQIKILYITVGLPASGKTTWAKNFVNSSKGGYIYHIETDKFLRKYHGCNTMEDVIKNRLANGSVNDKIILDGLFLTENDIIKVLNVITENKVGVKEVIIHYWKPNREICLWNDLYRRGTDSAITISNGVVDAFENVEVFKTTFPNIKFSIERHEIIKVEAYQLFAAKHNITLNSNGEYNGDSWCTGGSWCDCWGGGGSVGSDPTPEGMDVLDSLLEEITPSISFLQYKKIMNNCVHIDTYSDGDYYGGTTYHNQYVLNVSCLYKYLIENELIEEIK